MSQFGAPSYDGTPAKRSGLAVASLVCSLIFFCPLTTLLGPLLGLIALATMGGDPPKRGKGMAIAGILLGIIFTAGQGVFTFTVGAKGFTFVKDLIEFTMAGPNDALTAGASGDVAGFKAHFHGDGALATDEEAGAFLDELENRYGGFLSAEFDQQSGQSPQTRPGQVKQKFPYLLDFENAQIQADAELVYADESTGEMLKKLGYIIVYDAELGDLRYPSEGEAFEPAMDEEADPGADGDGS